MTRRRSLPIATDEADDSWFFHDERDHAWHTERRYAECRLCLSTPDEVDEVES